MVLPEANIPAFFQHINSKEQTINFTLEQEVNNCISFLDMSVKRTSDFCFETSVFRKETHTHRQLDFKSHHPMAHKRSVVLALMKRAEALVSTRPAKEKEFRFINEMLDCNGVMVTLHPLLNKQLAQVQDPPPVTMVTQGLFCLM